VNTKAVCSRFIQVIDHLTVVTGKNVKDLCQDLEFSAGYVTNLRRKPVSIGSHILINLYRKYKVNPIFILLGEGEMILTKKDRSLNAILSVLEAKQDKVLELQGSIITKMLEALISVNVLPSDVKKQLAQKGIKKSN
jgi:hypothetical protein